MSKSRKPANRSVKAPQTHMILSRLQYRILEISYKKRLSHIGSCLGAVPILEHIYSKKKENEPYIASNGHIGLALYCILEKYEGANAEELFDWYGVHPSKDIEDGIWCSTGSLGLGLSLAVGRALADRSKNVYVSISDGEIREGIVWESLNFARLEKLNNLQVYLQANDYAAYRFTPLSQYLDVISKLFPNIKVSYNPIDDLQIPFLHGQDAHYYVMNEKDWDWVQKQEIEN